MAMDSGQINAVYRLHHEEKWTVRRIARELHIARKTIKKYLRSPAAVRATRKPRKTKLDDFKTVIRELVERDAKAGAVVIAERLCSLGFTGERNVTARVPKITWPIEEQDALVAGLKLVPYAAKTPHNSESDSLAQGLTGLHRMCTVPASELESIHAGNPKKQESGSIGFTRTQQFR